MLTKPNNIKDIVRQDIICTLQNGALPFSHLIPRNPFNSYNQSASRGQRKRERGEIEATNCPTIRIQACSFALKSERVPAKKLYFETFCFRSPHFKQARIAPY